MCETFSRVRTLVCRTAIGFALCVAATYAVESSALADGYPDRTVRIIVPFPAEERPICCQGRLPIGCRGNGASRSSSKTALGVGLFIMVGVL
jgi:hypothetical protein